MIIDFKMKPPIPQWEQLFKAGRKPVTKQFSNLPDFEPTTAETYEDVIKEMDDTGITKAVILGRNNSPGSSNEELYEFLKSDDNDRFYGFIGIEDLTVEEAVETIEKYGVTNLFSGVAVAPTKIEPHTQIDDERLNPIFDACMKFNLPFCITLSMLLTLNDDEADYDYINPKHLIPVLQKFPAMKVIVSHAGWPFIQEGIAVAMHFRNLYLCPDFYMGFPGAEVLAEAADKGLGEQILYASCYPNAPYDYALAQYRKYFSEEVMDNIMYKNAEGILNK